MGRGGGAVAGDHLPFHPGHAVEQAWIDRRGGPGSGERRFLGLENVEGLHRRGVPDVGHFDVRREPADPVEPGDVVAHARRSQELLLGDRLRHDAERAAVLGRHGVEIIRGAHRGGARHVRHHDRGAAGQMPAEMAREHAGIKVIAAAGTEAHRNGHGLAGKARRVLRGGNDSAEQHQSGDARQATEGFGEAARPSHHVAPRHSAFPPLSPLILRWRGRLRHPGGALTTAVAGPYMRAT